jgi:internalin A
MNESGDLIVIDIGNAKLRLVKDGMVSTIAGNTDSDPLKIDFIYPIDLAFDGDDILIADAGNNKIYRIKPGVSAEEIQLNDTLKTPHGITTDNNGNIYIADMGTNSIIKIDKEGNFVTLVETTTDTTSVSNLKKPAAVLFDHGYLWIADLNNHQIKRLGLSN